MTERGLTTVRTRWLRSSGLVLGGLAALWLAWSISYFGTQIVTESAAVIASSDRWRYDEQHYLNDFGSYLNAAARLATKGTLYEEATLAGPYLHGPFGLYVYAPPLGVALLPFIDWDLAESAWMWLLAHVIALVGACALMPVRPLIRLYGFVVAAFSPMILMDTALGNVSVLLLLPLSIAWRWLDRPLGSIAQVVAISVRPTLGILVLGQLLRRQWLAVAWVAAAGIALVILTLPVVGVNGYLDFIAVLRNMAGVSHAVDNRDLGSAMAAAGGNDLAGLSLLAGYVIVIGAVLLSLRRDREVSYMVTLAGSLLLAPILWDHYLATLVLPAVFLAGRGRAWALVLPLLVWVPTVVEPWGFLYPIIVIAAVFLPFLARDARPGSPDQADVALSTPFGRHGRDLASTVSAP